MDVGMYVCVCLHMDVGMYVCVWMHVCGCDAGMPRYMHDMRVYTPTAPPFALNTLVFDSRMYACMYMDIGTYVYVFGCRYVCVCVYRPQRRP
jgi:hypothetical protein